MDEEEKTAVLEESEPRPEKSGREEQPSFARDFERAKKEIDRKLDEAGVAHVRHSVSNKTRRKMPKFLIK